MGSDGSAYDEVSALLRAARRSLAGIPTAFDLDSLLIVALSEAERLHKQGMLERSSPLGGVQVILSSAGKEERPAPTVDEEPGKHQR